MPNLDDLQNDPLISDAIRLIGPLPAVTGISSTPASTIVPRSVAAEVIGFDFNLDNPDRAAIIDALTRAFPFEIDPATQKPVLKPASAQPLSMRTAIPVVGKMKVAVIALRALAEHANQLDVGALKPCDADACGPEPLVALIRRCVQEIVQAFESGIPNPHAVDSALLTLSGFDAADAQKSPCDPDTVAGYIGKLGARCKMDVAAACGVEGENSVSSYGTLVGLTTIFANAWIGARDMDTPSAYFAVNIHEVHQHLFAVVSTLERLRRAVPAADWVTAEIPADPCISAATLWEWMHRFCASTALELLRHGRDGKAAVADRMAKFGVLVAALHKGRKPACGLRAFYGEPVQELIKDLQCHVQKVSEAVAC